MIKRSGGRCGRPAIFAVSEDPSSQGQLDHLRTVNLHLRMVVDQISEGAMILEAGPTEGAGPRIVFLNRGLCRMAGCRAEDLLGQPLGSLFEEEKLEDFLAVLPKVAHAGKAFLTRALLRNSAAGSRPCRWTVSCVRDPEGQPLNFLLTVADESPPPAALSAADEETEDARLHEVARLESLEVIASGIAHDFRNDLTAVMLNVSNAAALTAGNESQRAFMADAIASARHAKALADQLMEFARGATPVMKVADIGSLIHESVRLALSGSRSICHVQLAPDLWQARVDPTRIKQVVNNLLINASQAMPKGGTILALADNVVLEAESGVDAAPGPYVRIRVQDRGDGIPPEILPNIFKRNFTTKESGNGLGLASSYHIVRSHAGAITVQSRPRLGTEFCVYLPACPAEAGLEEEAAPAPARPARRGSGSVLIVDDQHVVRAAVKASVKALGYEAAEACNGDEAVEIYRRRLAEGRPFQLVLMDLTFPGGHSGDEALKEILALDASARVIASSGALEADSLETYREMGYVGVLPKPFDVDRLAAALEEASASAPVCA